MGAEMTTPYKMFSRLEYLGIVLMLFGLVLGFYSTYLSAIEVSAGRADYEAFISFRTTTVSEMKRSFAGMMTPMKGVEAKLAISRGGLYLFLSGFGLIVLAKRRRPPICAGAHYGKENHTEQGVAPYVALRAPSGER